ncbi:MAG: S8 family serine peptidase [Promethearchaeota archaeon]
MTDKDEIIKHRGLEETQHHPNKLWILHIHPTKFHQSNTHNHFRVLSHVSPEYLVALADYENVVTSSTIQRYAVLEPEHKFNPNLKVSHPELHVDFGVVVRMVDTDRNHHSLLNTLPDHDACTVEVNSKKRLTIVCLDLDGVETLVMLQNIASIPTVLWIDALPIFKPLDVNGIKDVFDSGMSLSQPYKGDDITVMVTDSGLDTNHCSFGAESVKVTKTTLSTSLPFTPIPTTTHPHIRTYMNIHTSYFGQSFITDHEDYTSGHGTHVAGTLVGQHDCVVSDNKGAAPHAKLFMVDCGIETLNYFGSPIDLTGYIFLPSDIEKLLLTGYHADVTVHSMSWGSDTGDAYDDMASQFDEFVRTHPTIINVAASGNTFGEVVSPAVAKNIISVGSSNRRSSVSSFSGGGNTADGRIAPLIVAPGEGVVSAYANGSPTQVTTKNGTSMSTSLSAGLVSGISDMIFSNHGHKPTESLMRAIFAAFGEDLVTMGIDSREGFGIPSHTSQFWAMTNWEFYENQTVSSNSAIEYEFEAVVSETHPIALAWTDLASFPGSSKRLINDLDLKVEVNNLVTYYGNGQDTDTINNEERIRIPLLVGDHVVITISAKGLNTPTQDFSLVINSKMASVGIVPTEPPAPTPPTITQPPSRGLSGSSSTITISLWCLFLTSIIV